MYKNQITVRKGCPLIGQHAWMEVCLPIMQFDMSLTFDSLLEPLTSSLVRSAPQTLVCTLIRRLPLVLPLRDQTRPSGRQRAVGRSVSQSVTVSNNKYETVMLE